MEESSFSRFNRPSRRDSGSISDRAARLKLIWTWRGRLSRWTRRAFGVSLLCAGLGLLFVAFLLATNTAEPTWRALLSVAASVAAGFFLTSAVVLLCRAVPLQAELPADERVRELEIHNRNAEAEIARLRSQCVRVESIEQILALGLVEVEVAITDFKREVIDSSSSALWRRASTTEYVGCVTLTRKLRFGIDLRSVVVRADGESIQIGRLKPEFQGGSGERVEWHARELQQHEPRSHGVLAANTAVIIGDARVHARSQVQQSELADRIESGRAFPWMDAAVRRAGETTLRLLLAPTGRGVEFLSDEIRGQPLLEFLSAHNRALENRIQELERDGRSPR